MSYGRLSKPRFFMDNMNWLFSRGRSRDTYLTINTGAGFIDLNSGSTKYQMFDMSPSNDASFDTGGTTDTVSIMMDYSLSSFPTDHIIIMNHNLDTSGGKIRVAHDTVPITTVGGGTGVTNLTSVLNGAVTSSVSYPAEDGDTVLTFDSSSDRYWVVEFYDVATWTATDLTIGEIVLGEYYTMPVSPDMPVTKSRTHEGVSVRRSYGGKSFGSASWIMANMEAYTPFRTNTSVRKMSGRESFAFSVSFMDDSSIYPSDMQSPSARDNFVRDVINKAGANLIPFIFLADSESTTEGDFLYSRFDSDTFTTDRQAWQVEGFKIKVVQEF